MSIRQTLQAAPNGTVWTRREGGTTYFLRKVNNTYEVWTSLASGAKSTVTADQAVTYYSQHNLINANTAAPAPAARPAAPTRPTPQPTPPAPTAARRPATVPATTPTTSPDIVVTAPRRPVANTADIPLAITTASDLPITIATEPVTVDIPQFDRRGRQTGTEQVTIALDPITIDDEPLAVSVIADADVPLVVPGIDEAALAEIGASAQAQIDEMLAVANNPFQARSDWRVRLALSDDPSVNYLYKAPNPGILNPLNATNGVIFPYTPTISVNYAANYNPTELVHSNYKVFQYSSSSVDSINIQCDFTAQDEYEANYLLAVIHFFRSATKMFYGQDQNPRRGTPPPLCYIYGMGSYQFAGQPLAIQQFSYNLPNNVDYITTSAGTGEAVSATATDQPSRMAGTGVARGGVLPPPQFAPIAEPGTVSWVPSKIQLSITCVPMMNRNAVSNEFSFEKYATGSLLNGVQSRSGGFW
jgi:hypothetical protein